MEVWFLLIISLIPIIGGMILVTLKNKINDNMTKIFSYMIVLSASVLTWIAILTIPNESFEILTIVEGYSITLRFDALGKVFAGMVSILWPLALMYSFGYMAHDERKATYNVFYVMTFGVVLGLSFSANLLTMFIFYEMLTFITLPLIVHDNTKEAKRAGQYYLNFSLSGSSLALVGMIMITSSCFGTNDFSLLFESTMQPDLLFQIGFILCFFGFGVKSAIYPLHFWLPMAGAAPTPTTALLHAVAVVKAGVFALIRITFYLGGAAMLQGTWIQQMMIIIASFTIVFGSVRALKEQHLKRRFAYSTISNLSYIILGISFMCPLGLVAALLHLVIHSITKICLFFCCGEIIENSESKIKYVYQLDGIGKKMPVTMICFFIAGCSITGVPLFAGFVSKFYLLQQGFALNNVFGYIGVFALIISALLTAIYSLSIPFKAFVNKRNDLSGEGYDLAHENSIEMLFPIVVFAALCIVLGVGSTWFVELLLSMFGL